MRNGTPAPATGQARNGFATSAATTLMINGGGQSVIKFMPPPDCWSVDARAGRASLRYTSDPGTGIWRAGGDGVRDHVSPFALQRISVGRHGVEAEVTHPQTRNVWSFEGDLDNVATLLWRAGRRYGCQAERQTVFWALREFCAAVHRQAAARGVSA
jgi:hypothetical protein